jgi:hypothetical protein
MSDRESVSGVSGSPWGSGVWVHAPKSGGECSEALCELIQVMAVLLKGWAKPGFCAEDDDD